MPFQTPTLPQLVQRVADAFRANLKGSDARLWPNNVAVSAKVKAGALFPAYRFIEYVSRQIFAATADAEFLERHAAEYGMARLPASFAEGEVTLYGDTGVTVPAGLTLQRADGTSYVTTTAGRTVALIVPLDDAEASVTVKARAVEPGRAGNTFAGVEMTLVVPRDRILSTGVVAAAGIGAGADEENDASLRARVLFRKRNPPHGGAAHDYVAWAREVAGVTRVFVDPVTETNARTSVGVWFLMDDTYVNGIPQAADVTRLRSYIDQVRPAAAMVSIAAPTAVPVAISISGLTPDTTAVRDAVVLELQDLFRRSSRVSTLTEPYVLRVSKIWEAISTASGEESHTLVAPANDIAVPLGSIATLGSITIA